jgi:hypothetical protein
MVVVSPAVGGRVRGRGNTGCCVGSRFGYATRNGSQAGGCDGNHGIWGLASSGRRWCVVIRSTGAS